MVCSRASIPWTYGGSTHQPCTSSSPAWRMASCLSCACACNRTVSRDTMLMALACLHNIAAGFQRLHQLVEDWVVQELCKCDDDRIWRLLAREVGQRLMRDNNLGVGGNRADGLMRHVDAEAGLLQLLFQSVDAHNTRSNAGFTGEENHIDLRGGNRCGHCSILCSRRAPTRDAHPVGGSPEGTHEGCPYDSVVPRRAPTRGAPPVGLRFSVLGSRFYPSA